MTVKNLVISFMFIITGSIATVGIANEISPEELERWFNSDTTDPPRYDVTSQVDASQVNEGELVFLSKAPDKAPHYQHNEVTISPASLRDGWILVEQCHSNIDKVAAAQIVFAKNRVRNIKIISYKNIERAWVEGASVQFENVKSNATLCIQANTHSLKHLENGTYSLRNGPFMRRFLDGYFPMHVSFGLHYAQTNLELTSFTPARQKGFEVKLAEGQIKIDTLFEGRLFTEFHFKPKSL